MKKDNRLLIRLRYLSQALMGSVTLNIGLIGAFSYWLWKESPPVPYYELKPAETQQQNPLADERSNGEVLRSYKTLAFEQLIAKLENRQLVENGYSQRDLALACLVTFHCFDLDRALSYVNPVEHHRIAFQDKDDMATEIMVYPGLNEEQYKAISHFAITERWPLTPAGLFSKLQKSPPPLDVSLLSAFFLSTPFTTVETLFKRAEILVTREELLAVLMSGTWEMLTEFTEQQRVSQDLSTLRRERFLLDYIGLRSRPAALLLLKTDFHFAAKKLEDEKILLILSLLDANVPEAQTFALEVSMSPRSEGVRKLAESIVYPQGEEKKFKGKSSSALTDLSQLPLQMESKVKETKITLPIKSIVKKKVTSPKKAISQVDSNKESIKSKKTREHVVQQGDSLWKIARLYKTNVQSIRQINQLQSDVLKVGSLIKIPES